MQKNESFLLVWEILKTISIILILVVVIRGFVIQPFKVYGSSMEPTFHQYDYLIINEIGYRLFQPRRSDVVVLKHPTPECDAYLSENYFQRLKSNYSCQHYLKRIVAIPGDTIKIQDGQVSLKTKENGDFQVLNEAYIKPNTPTLGWVTKELGSNEYFVLGDNREPNASSDSREWGVLKKDHLVGKVMVRLYPEFKFF